ncbi:hypothetical protein [Lignipirellula cremea]|uniref:hypothetical protein n=1 Tax=Lignipirellula cremea TaxID=2528010 RepID=UPI0011AB126D|nr:hypothetical protein [Lignipirellula cremea]
MDEAILSPMKFLQNRRLEQMVFYEINGSEVVGANISKLKWRKTKVSDAVARQMDVALLQLDQRRNQRHQRITHLFGKMLLLTIEDVIVFTAGTHTRPASIVAIALVQNANGEAFFLDEIDGMEACCDHLGMEDQVERREFSRFVSPKSKQ